MLSFRTIYKTGPRPRATDPGSKHQFHLNIAIMIRLIRSILLVIVLSLLATASSVPTAAAPGSPLVARVADTGFIQLEAESFRQLNAQQQALAYWLTQASIAIDPIFYDQASRFGLREKRILEEIVSRPAGIPDATFGKIRSYALLFWANRGNHNETTAQKFVPTFTPEELEQAALRAQQNGGFKTPSGDLKPLPTAEDVRHELTDLRQAFFDPAFEPMMTAKTPPP